MTLQQLICFREVAREKHFTRAAENLFVAQSSLSHSIQELEAEIGAPLFLRKNGKRVVITRYGEALLPFAENALNEIDAGMKQLSQMISPSKGIVNIAYTFINGYRPVTDLKNAFYENGQHSDILIHSIVNHGTLAFIEDRLTLCDADLAISCTRFSENSHIESLKLFEQELCVVVPAGHPLSSKSEISLHELKNEPILMFSGSYNLYDKTVQLFEYEGIKPNYIDGHTDWTELLLDVSRGEGVSILPKLDFGTQSVKYVKLSHPNNSRDVYLLWSKDKKLSPAALTVKNFCVDYFHQD